MNPSQILSEVTGKYKKAAEHFSEELKKLRTGRATPGMVEGVLVTAYGTQMPLLQVATISTPEPQLIQISPFDVSNLEAIVTAIRDNQTLGLNPSDDGRVVRIQVPPLTEERRRDIAKQISEKVEEAMIVMRQARHEARERIDQDKKDKALSQDDADRLQKQVDEAMAKSKSDIEVLSQTKEREIMTV